MTNAELIRKIRNEIDKRYVEYREKMKTDDFTYYEGMADALDLFEQFLDTLESEKPMNLEEEIDRFEDWMETYNQADYPTSFTTRDIARHFYELGRSEKPNNPEGLDEAAWRYVKNKYGIYDPQKVFENEEIAEDFKAGYNLCKEQMMKEAVEGFVFQAEDYYPKELIARYDGKLKHGDKVRVIVIPNTDEK